MNTKQNFGDDNKSFAVVEITDKNAVIVFTCPKCEDIKFDALTSKLIKYDECVEN